MTSTTKLTETSSSNELFSQLMEYSSKKDKKKSNMTHAEKLLSDIEGYGYNLSELKDVLVTRGHQLVVSCAGSGKTTGLIFKILYDLVSGRASKLIDVNGNPVKVSDSIWVATFLKTGADELESAFRRWCNKLNRANLAGAVQFSTLHAEFKRALNQLGIPTDIISDKENESLLKKVIATYNLKNEKGYNLTAEDIRNLASALTYTRNRLDSSRYKQLIYDELRITNTIIDSILTSWKMARMNSGKCDFEDLQERLYTECYVRKNSKIIDFLADRYKYIYVDEFQDTSQIQYAILQIYASRCRQLVVIGDDDQTIYSWRGSDNSIITTKFVQDFSPTKNNLNVNFRCPNNILSAIKPSIEKNISRFDKNLSSFNDGGVVRVGAYPGYRQMALALGDMVYEDVKEGRSVAILCRVNSDGLMPAIFFDKLDKFTFSVSGKGMTFDSYIGRMAFSIIKLFTERSTPDVKRALKQLTWDEYSVNRLIDICKTNKCSIWSIGEKDLAYSCPSLSDVLLEWRSWRDSLGEIRALQLVLQQYRTDVFAKDNQFNDVMRSVLISIEALLDYQNYDSVEDFLMDLQDVNDALNARQKRPNVKVRIATVHEFKGKEADSVYVWNDSEDVFPYKLSINTLEEFEEERRVHYIACTRAKKISTIMYIKNRKGQFLDEMNLSSAELLKGETSGILGQLVNRKMEETGNMKEFRKTAVEEEETFVMAPQGNDIEENNEDEIELDFDSFPSDEELDRIAAEYQVERDEAFEALLNSEDYNE